MGILRPSSRDDAFFQLLADSARQSVLAAETLTQMLAAEPAEREALLPRLKDIEHDADEVTHAVIHKVNSSFVTPFDHADILELAAASSPSDPTGPVGPGDRRGSGRDADGGADVIDLSRERERRRPGLLTFLAVAAAAVVLLVGGVMIGRLTDGTGSENLPTAAPPSGTMPRQVTSLLAAEDLAARLPISRQAIAKHLALLGDAGLVTAEPGERRHPTRHGRPDPLVGHLHRPAAGACSRPRRVRGRSKSPVPQGMSASAWRMITRVFGREVGELMASV